MCEYKSEFSCEYYPVISKDIQFEGMYDPFPRVEYDTFIFEVDSMQEMLNKEGLQFQSDSYMHADQNVYSEQAAESKDNCYMHYKSGDIYSVLLNAELQDVDMIGKTDRRRNFNLPHQEKDENYVYDRGKHFVEVWWPGAIVCM